MPPSAPPLLAAAVGRIFSVSSVVEESEGEGDGALSPSNSALVVSGSRGLRVDNQAGMLQVSSRNQALRPTVIHTPTTMANAALIHEMRFNMAVMK